MKPSRDARLISVVLPVFNERACIEHVARRLSSVFSEMKLPYELIFVDDGSSDGSFEVIRGLNAQDSNVQGIRFSKNRGQQTALSAGLEIARGDVVVTMDADGQHPPEMLPQMLQLWRQGYDVINTVKEAPAGSTPGKALFSGLFYKIFNAISDDLKLTPSCSDFRLLDRKCVHALNQIQERLKFYRGLVEYIGFSQTTLSFVPPPRLGGNPAFTVTKSLVMGVNAIFNYSTMGLKAPFVLGSVLFGLSVLYLLVAIAIELFSSYPLVRGWPSLLALSIAFFGAQFFFTGIIGLYIGKIFLEIKKRPAYFIDESIGFGVPRSTPSYQPASYTQRPLQLDQ